MGSIRKQDEQKRRRLEMGQALAMAMANPRARLVRRDRLLRPLRQLQQLQPAESCWAAAAGVWPCSRAAAAVASAATATAAAAACSRASKASSSAANAICTRKDRESPRRFQLPNCSMYIWQLTNSGLAAGHAREDVLQSVLNLDEKSRDSERT